MSRVTTTQSEVAPGQAQRWIWSTIGEVADVTAGNPAPQGEEYFHGEGIPFVRVHDMGRLGNAVLVNDTRDRVSTKAARTLRLFPKGAVLFTKSGASTLLNQRAILGAPMYVVSHIGVALPGASVTSEWIYYWLRTIDFGKLTHATTLPSLPLPKIRAIPIPVVPLDEQRRIVADLEEKLSDLDAGISALRRTQSNLKRYRASVLLAACEGRLVPTEAELARRERRSYETGAGLLARILDERKRKWSGKGKYKDPSPADTGNLASCPEGWVWATVHQISVKVVDGVHKKPEYFPKGVPFVTVRNLTAGPGVSFERVRYVKESDHEEFSKRANPEAGDILVSKDGTLGVVRVVPVCKPFSIFVSVALVKPALPETSTFLGIALSSPTVQAQMVPKGTGLQHIHLEDLRQDCVPMPPLPEQQRIVEEVERRLSIVEELEREVEVAIVRGGMVRRSVLANAFRMRPKSR